MEKNLSEKTLKIFLKIEKIFLIIGKKFRKIKKDFLEKFEKISLKNQKKILGKSRKFF